MNVKASSQNSLSTTESALARNAYESDLRNDMGLHTYIFLPLDECDINAFADVDKAVGNGNCGPASVVKDLRRSISDQLQYDSHLQDELADDFEGHNYFRYELRQFIQDNYIEFSTCSDPVFVDEYGQPDNTFIVKTDAHGNASKTCFDSNGQPCSNMDVVMDRIYQRYV